MKHRLLFLALFSLGCATATTDTMSTGGEFLTDGDIVQIVSLVNRGEVDQARLAQTRASSADVREFAQMMITDHQNAQSQLEQDNIPDAAGGGETARLLEASAAATVAALRTYTGATFDRAYMQSQVDQHRWTLNALDQSLVPGARDGDLRGQLLAIRASVAAHLARAQQLAAR